MILYFFPVYQVMKRKKTSAHCIEPWKI